jgi:hypothetical protein
MLNIPHGELQPDWLLQQQFAEKNLGVLSLSSNPARGILLEYSLVGLESYPNFRKDPTLFGRDPPHQIPLVDFSSGYSCDLLL